MKFILSALLILSAASARAEVIYLREGGSIIGRVTSSDGTTIVVRTANGTIRIPQSKVDRIDYGTGRSAESAPAPAAPPPPVRSARTERYYGDPGPIGEGSRLLSFGLGFANPLGTIDFSQIRGGGSDRIGALGAEMDFRAIYMTSPYLGFGFGTALMIPGDENSTALIPNTSTDLSGGSAIFEGLFHWIINPNDPARVHVTGGLGFHVSSLTADSTPLPGFHWSDTGSFETRRLIDDSDAGFAGSLHAGVDFPINPALTIGGETGFYWTDYSYKPTSTGQYMGLSGVSGNNRFWTLSGRLTWRFF